MDSSGVRVVLYSKRSNIFRLDVLPFAILYLICVIWGITELGNDNFVWVGAAYALVALLHILTFLFCQWFVDFRAWVTLWKVYLCIFCEKCIHYYLKERDVNKATIAKVTPLKARGKTEFCALQKSEVNILHITYTFSFMNERLSVCTGGNSIYISESSLFVQ
jgi:hypothetical protein